MNWLSERGEYSKAALHTSLWQQLSDVGLFLLSDFHFLSLQLHDGDGLSSMLLGLKRMLFDQRMRSQELANPLAERTRSVPANDPHSRVPRHRVVIPEFVP